ncbi:MAG: nitroreductase family deazaflavin-dependent oxidoreductase [Kineosporiaceae bacterium]
MGVSTDLGLVDRGAGWWTRVVGRAVAHQRVSAAMSRVLDPVDRLVRRVSGGRVTATEALTGLPTVVLTTRGARSGLPRTVPLIAVPHRGDVAVIGSHWGRPTHPAWVANLRATPRATLERGRRSVAVVARPLEGAEAEEVWTRARALYPGYDGYRRRAGREIAVFRLERA